MVCRSAACEVAGVPVEMLISNTAHLFACGNGRRRETAAIIPSIDSEGTNSVLANDFAGWPLRALRGMTKVFTGLTESGS